MSAKPLIELLAPDGLAAPANPLISNITSDSRAVKPGALFFALKGVKSDGAAFVTAAALSGAAAVVVDADATLPPLTLPVIRSKNPRLTFARAAAAFYGAQPSALVAVTGTDGKSSTADFFRQFWYVLGAPSASIGTLGVFTGTGEKRFEGTHTTPDQAKLHEVLAALAHEGIQHVCMEASSHGLDQYRLHGAKLKAAGFTNIARDHLDYHGTEEAYFAAKARLFSEVLPEGGVVVANADDAKFAALQSMCAARGQKLWGFGRKGVELQLLNLTPEPHGQALECILFGKKLVLHLPLVGAFQAMNVLAAMGLSHAVGAPLDALVAATVRLLGVRGRLEHAATLAHGAAIYVDYAHTPLALTNVLSALRPHTQGKLHLVFGCGGDRDAGKRPVMGEIASRLADVITITDDNPRSENPASIRAAILAACPGAKAVAGREEAIYGAVCALAAGDVLVIAGKGHEETQTIGDTIYPFDDVAVAKRAAADL